MKTNRIVFFCLMLVMCFSITCNAFATEVESTKTLDGLEEMKAYLEEKGLTIEEAKANFERMFEDFAKAGDMTPEEAKARIAELKENGNTLENLVAQKAYLEEKGLTLQEAKTGIESKMAESGKTAEEIAEMREKLQTKREENKGIKREK